MRLLTILLLLLMTTTHSFALTLDEAIHAALQNHQRIEQFSARAAQSAAEVGTAKSTFLPKLNLNYSYLDRQDDPHNLGQQRATLALAASINLFNGRSDYHRLNASKQRASGSEYRLQGTRADIILETQIAYIEVLRAIHSIATAAEGVDLLEQQKRDAQLKFDYGLIARNDLLRVEVELSSARQHLLQAEGQQQINRSRLERTIGIPISTHERIEELTTAAMQDFAPEQITRYQQEMFDNRSELHYLRNELQASKSERRANRGGYLPSIDLSAAHEEYNNQLSPLSSEENDNILALQASWNLFDGFAREQAIASSDANIRAIAAERRDTEAELVLQLKSALQNNRIARGRQQEARSGVTSAEENYRVTENRFQQQQATTVDLLDAQFLLTRSRNLEINSRYDLFLSTVQLERILERKTN